MVGAGMHQQQVFVLAQQRQLRQKILVRRTELGMGPERALFAHVLDLTGWEQGQIVVVAAHRPGTRLHGQHDGVEHSGGLAAIAHHVAQKGQLGGTLRLCVGHAGLQRLQIAVDV